jgi:hypothetical protein
MNEVLRGFIGKFVVVDHLHAVFNALLDDVCLVTLRSAPFA